MLKNREIPELFSVFYGVRQVSIFNRTGRKNAIVPLVSVYEGIQKRGECANVFHIGSYGKKTEDIWDEVLTELEKRYDLSETSVCLRGDGANWIRSGLEYLPNAVFVLDPYHKSKYTRKR